jgi:toxin ParE1/3/4
VPTLALTDKAHSDLDAIHEHYVEHSGPVAAGEVMSYLIEGIEQLRTFSGIGRPSQTPDVRELVFTRYPFIAPYRVIRGEIQVLRVLHQGTERLQDW